MSSLTLATGCQKITIGTRASKLALAQTALVVEALRTHHPTLEIHIETMTTKGDVTLNRPLREIGGAGLFVTAIEDALRNRQVDLAVHSAKDLPSTLPDDMALIAFPPRADARDVMISRTGHSLTDLPPGARIGTSSIRRICQLRNLRPDVDIVDLRGNVDTRLRKLQEGAYDAIILAKAGLDRLNLTDHLTQILEPEVLLPAVAQGALALEIRAAEGAGAALGALLAPLDDWITRLAVQAERAFLARIGGGCHVPVAAYAEVENMMLTMGGMVGATDGRLVQASVAEAIGTSEGSEETAIGAAHLGMALAEQLLAAGGDLLLLER